MELLRLYYEQDVIDQQLLEELQSASNRQDDKLDYRCTADSNCLGVPVWAHSTPQNHLDDLAERAGPIRAKRVYAITMKRTGPKIELEVPRNAGAGYFSCNTHEAMFQAIDGKAHLSTATKQLQILHGWKAISWSLHVLAKTSISFDRRTQIVIQSWDNIPYAEETLQRIIREMEKQIRKLPIKDEKRRLLALSKLPKSFRDCIKHERDKHQRANQATLSYSLDYQDEYLRPPGTIRTIKREVDSSPRLGCTAALSGIKDHSILTLTVLPQFEKNNHVALLTFPARLSIKPEFRDLERLFNPGHTSEMEFQGALSDLIIKTQNFSFRPSVYDTYEQSLKDRLELSQRLDSSHPLLTMSFNERAGISQRYVNLFSDADGTVV